ncbi:MAG: AMP-binding protein [Planctomycetales bacterium]|nr:AMP-binding protein [Planctomycetales bacterium]
MNVLDSTSPLVTLRLLQQLKDCGKRFKIADSTGAKLTGIDLLTRILALRSCLERDVLSHDEQQVGIFLPPTVVSTAVNLAISLTGRVAVNLNYTVSSSVLKQCSELAGLKQVITSRKFLDKVGLDVGVPTVFMEDLKNKVTVGDKLFAYLNARFRSATSLHSWLGLDSKTHNDPLTIIFTSGSTGQPKGVVLTLGNIESNVDAILQAINLSERDVVLGVLPFFHSFGYTVAMWTAMALPCSAVYHFSPLEARPIGKLAGEFGATVLLATPTFLRTYIRRVEKEQFSKLDTVIVGAEKMPIPLAEEFEQTFGVRPIEGYGTTELSPLVSVNVPPCRGGNAQNYREGTIGKPVVRVETRIVGIESDQPLPVGETGLLEVRGPNVMLGYYKRPDLTAQVMHDDWYRTGDVGFIDKDGFVTLTGRLSRFSKIGGEMVPHILIEQAMTDIVGMDDQGLVRVAVTSVPDPKRGEKLIVLHTKLPVEKPELLRQLAATGLPNIYLPGEDGFVEVEQIPMLGSGKLDLKGIKETAEKAFSN